MTSFCGPIRGLFPPRLSWCQETRKVLQGLLAFSVRGKAVGVLAVGPCGLCYNGSTSSLLESSSRQNANERSEAAANNTSFVDTEI